MKTKTPAQQASVNLAAQYLEMARSRLIEAGEPALALSVGGLITRAHLTTSYTPPFLTPETP